MDTRDIYLEKLRPRVDIAAPGPETTPEEQFQNETLRPVIKAQNDLLVESFRNYIETHKNAYHKLSAESKLEYIENTIHKDIKYRNSLKGMIVGLFTLEEYHFYAANSSALSRRMMQLVRQRLQSNLQLFETAETPNL